MPRGKDQGHLMTEAKEKHPVYDSPEWKAEDAAIRFSVGSSWFVQHWAPWDNTFNPEDWKHLRGLDRG